MKPGSIPILLHDAAAVALAWWLGYLLRFNFAVPEVYAQGFARTLPVVLPVYLVVFALARVERGLWRFAGLPDVERIVAAVAAAALLALAALYASGLSVYVPRAVAVIAPLMAFFIMSGSRLLYRRMAQSRAEAAGGRTDVLILGAGSAAALLLRDIASGSSAMRQWRVVGLLDDDPFKKGRQIQGVTVLGSLADLPAQARRLGVGRVVIAMPSASLQARTRAARLAEQAGVAVMTVPGMDDLLSGRVAVSAIRSVEPEALLAREAVTLDEQRLRGLLSDKVVMVTGAGGSIGAELCRQIAQFGPRRLVLFEANEFAMYGLEQEFRAGHPAVPIQCAMGDVKDGARLRQVLQQHRPDVLFHAAAYKHVPLMENDNVWEAVRNNVLGTLVTARAAIDAGVGRFVLVSTDKAVNPTNVMGATKRLAEMACQALQASQGGTRFITVRFGNVLGSSGSVIPKFREQIAAGGPITVTHPDIVRYFMSIREAAQLVLQAGALGEGGEIFVLDMGEPVRIVDLARNMIRLSGFADDEIAIEFTGLRPGEKLFEELLFDSEATLETPHPKLRVAKARFVDVEWLARLVAWLDEERLRSDDEIKLELKGWVPEYSPASH
ncbi:MAG TPA: nucleoside-diphosphate sugar epimerase/dehydratase [Burkholderiales bacterium]|nr:nucleoside-diphosphate sugar epimerase/dehydratase [Burkholderiales bacterium]